MTLYTKEPTSPAQACVIWMHGLGADAQNMMALADQLLLTVPVRHVFMNAPVRPVTLNNHQPMRAWYDITGLRKEDREDREGIAQSERLIREVIQAQREHGFTSKQIFLAGFSQGGAIALHTGLNMPETLGGLMVLSGYLPLASARADVHQLATPVFIAAGTEDTVVLPSWTQHIYSWLQERDFEDVSWNEYPMDHSVCAKEIRDLSQWLNARVATCSSEEIPS